MILMSVLGDRDRPVDIPFQRKLTGRDLVRYVFTAIWFVYLIGPLHVLFTGHHHPALWVAGGIAAAAAFCALFLLLVVFSVTGRWGLLSPQSRTAHGVLCLLALLGCVVYGQQWITLWIFVSSATGWVYPFRVPVMRVLALVTGGYGLCCWITHAGMTEFLNNLLPVAFIGMATAGFYYQTRLVHELRQARETVAKLAASEERLRLARDMHDLTGQSLSMITLKSELVGKLLSRLPASKDRDQAASEAADIGRVSRQTLHDIREAVSGYRRPTLAVEIITAGTALESAGIELEDDPDLTLRSGTFDAETEAALAWCLREAVTNVIRHSGAKHCRVRLLQRAAELSLEVSDDGRGIAGQATPGGTGLRGMSERLTSVGGRLSFEHASTTGRGQHGLRIVATVPESAPASGPPAAGGPPGLARPGAPPPYVPAGSE
jgi:two-component system, NarL family, sensor histidine kinase DesK